jgi:hypothetical protein
MSGWSFRSRTVWIVPLVLVLVALLEEVMTYKVRQHVRDIRVRAAVILLLNAFAFGVAGGWLAPRMRDVLKGARKRTNKLGGAAGLLMFYALGYGAAYWAFLVLERSGPAGLLPSWLR